MLHIVQPGLQSTLQGAPRIGWRHLGFPYSGPTDPLSMALANRLVGNDVYQTCIEVTYGGFEAEVSAPCSIAIAGANTSARVSGTDVPAHRTLHLDKGDTIILDMPETGLRTYIAIRSGFQANQAFGATSTYLPATFGGHRGRALETGDRLTSNANPRFSPVFTTPSPLVQRFSPALALRACPSSEAHELPEWALDSLFNTDFTVGRQATRMGLSLEGGDLPTIDNATMKSAPVFPGTLQYPPSGTPIIMLCDAQTTGGYPRVAVIARCDRHLLGQARPGNKLRLLKRTPTAARHDNSRKSALLSTWLRQP